jgi:hypothetical protein
VRAWQGGDPEGGVADHPAGIAATPSQAGNGGMPCFDAHNYDKRPAAAAERIFAAMKARPDSWNPQSQERRT